MVTDRSLRVVERMLALWLLAGPQFAVKLFPHHGLGRTPTAVFRIMAAQGMSRWGLYVAAKTCGRVREAMWVSLFFVDERLRSAETVEVVVERVLPRPLIGGLPSASFDMYVREGKLAIRAFFRDSAAMQPFVQAMQPDQRTYGQDVGVFLAESAVPCMRVVYGAEQEAIRRWVRSPARMHWLPFDLASVYIQTIREHLDELTAARRKMVASPAEATTGPDTGTG